MEDRRADSYVTEKQKEAERLLIEKQQIELRNKQDADWKRKLDQQQLLTQDYD